MPIQFPDYQRISFDEANPMLMGLAKGQNLMQNFMQFPQELRAKILQNQIAAAQAKYAEPMAKEGLTHAQQENQWNPKIWQSEIGLRGAQAGKLGQETAWYGREAGARTALQQAQTQQAVIDAGMNQLKMNYLKQHLDQMQSGGQPAPMSGVGMPPPQGAGAMMPPQGGGMAPQQAPQQQMPPQQMAPQMPQQAGVPQAAMQQGGMPQQPMRSQQQGIVPGTPSNVSPAVAASSNSAYGIPTPQPTSQDIANKMLLGIDTFGDKQTQAYQQQKQQKDQYTKALAESIQQAGSAQKAQQALALFNNAMDASTYKGARLGHVPSQGWATALVPGDLSKEQSADWAANNMIPGAIADIREAMGAGQFSVADLNAARQMKFFRGMDDKTRATSTAFINGVWNRMQEKPKFYATLGNPQSGAQKANADLLWMNYQNQFPIIGKEGKTNEGKNIGNWPLYTTPKAIASVQSTGTYKPTASEKNTFMMQIPDGNGGYIIAPVKKGAIEEAFRSGAKPL